MPKSDNGKISKTGSPIKLNWGPRRTNSKRQN